MNKLNKLSLTCILFLAIFLQTSTASAGWLDDLWRLIRGGSGDPAEGPRHDGPRGDGAASNPVPEPGAALLFGAGAIALTWRMRQSR